MPPVPKRRHSTYRQGKRRATKTVSLPQLVDCPHCGEKKLPHRICPSCKKP